MGADLLQRIDGRKQIMTGTTYFEQRERRYVDRLGGVRKGYI